MSDNDKHSVDGPPKNWDSHQLKLRASFLQSSPWGYFQRQQGHKVYFLNGKNWSCLLAERRIPAGRYLFAPYGPTLAKPSSLKNCIEELKAYSRWAGADWLSLEPMVTDSGSAGLRDGLVRLGGKKVRNREPDLTRIVDLKPPAEEILAGISQSTRSFIRKSQREGLLSFQTSTDPSDIKLFTTMLGHVSGRNKVFFFTDEYFQKQAQTLMPAGMLRLEIALKDGQPVASALFHDYGETSSYTYAASLPEARQASASALLLWQAMLNAKERGVKQLDLFGIAPDDASSNHPWSGFSSFKKKFGGEVVAYAGTWDFPLSPKYRFYRAAQRLRTKH